MSERFFSGPIWLAGRYSPMYLDEDGNAFGEVPKGEPPPASDEEFQQLPTQANGLVDDAFRLALDDLPLTTWKRRCYGCGVEGMYTAAWGEPVFCAWCKEMSDE